MDIGTIIGLVAGSGLILSAIFMGGSLLMFIDFLFLNIFNFPSILIVIGGSVSTSFIKFSMSDVINTIKVVMKAFLFKAESQEQIIENMMKYAKIAKSEGLIALEKEKPEDEFAAKALRYLSDGIDEGLIEAMLKNDIKTTVKRHTVGQGVFNGLGATAPAFGMIGTLIGLVQMLGNMSDPSSIGPSMAIALLTTLYGAIAANLVFLPIGEKLAYRSNEEKENKSIILEATIGITRGTPPMVLEDALRIFLDPKTREAANTDKKKSEK